VAAKYLANDDLTIKANLFLQRFTTDDSPVFYLADSQYAASNPAHRSAKFCPLTGYIGSTLRWSQSGRDTHDCAQFSPSTQTSDSQR